MDCFQKVLVKNFGKWSAQQHKTKHIEITQKPEQETPTPCLKLCFQKENQPKP
jgi:hypothetical protein